MTINIKSLYSNHSNFLVAALFLVLVLIFCAPILVSGNNLGIEDWDHQTGFLESARKTVLEYHQFPFWDPYHCGGMPAFGNPQSGFISITFVFVLLMGTVFGVKASIVFHFFLACCTTYALSRYLKYSKSAAVAATLIFTFSGIISSALATGMLTLLYATYLPLIALFVVKSTRENKSMVKNALYAGFFLSLTFYGGYHIPLITIPVIGIYLLINAFTAHKIKPIIVGLIIAGSFLLFSAPKLIMSLSLIHQYPRIIADHSGYTLKGFSFFLISPLQHIHLNLPIQEDKDYNSGVDENSLYVGGLGLVLLGFFKSKPKFKILFLVLLLLLFGYFAPIALFEFLRKLPVYDQFRVAQRFRFPFALILAMAAAKAIDFINTRVKNRYVIYLMLCVLYLDLTVFTYTNFFTKTFTIRNDWTTTSEATGQPPKIANRYQATYDHASKSELAQKHPVMYLPWSSEYPALKENISHVECYETIPIKINRTETRTEFILNDPGKDIAILWSPNMMTLDVSGFTQDNVLINQNFIAGWHAKNENGEERKIAPAGGILSVIKAPKDKKLFISYFL